MSKYFLIYNFLKKKIGHNCARIIMNDVILHDEEKLYKSFDEKMDYYRQRNRDHVKMYPHRRSLSRTIRRMRHKIISGYERHEKKLKEVIFKIFGDSNKYVFYFRGKFCIDLQKSLCKAGFCGRHRCCHCEIEYYGNESKYYNFERGQIGCYSHHCLHCSDFHPSKK